MTTMKALETHYGGCRFRSRLEARWAVFFDHANTSWEYEPQGFRLPSGPYLPDFWLPEIDAYFEVKPDDPNISDDPRWGELADATGKDVYVAFGLPRVSLKRRFLIPKVYKPGWYEANFEGDPVSGGLRKNGHMEVFGPQSWDNLQAFCQCPHCGDVRIHYLADEERICGHGSRNPFGTWLAEAYIAARSARFEYGQSG